MKPSEILREAARSVYEEYGLGGCCAIRHVYKHNPDVLYYDARIAESWFSEFRPRPESLGFWWGLDDREPRIIALLLAADMAEDDGN